MKTKIRLIPTLLKSLLALFLLFTLLQMLSLFYETITETIVSDDDMRQKERLLKYAAEDQYGELYEELTLYDLSQTEYQEYWELCEAYRLYCQTKASQHAASASQETKKEAYLEEYASQYFHALLDFPSFSQNPTLQAALLRMQEKAKATF